MLLIGLDVVFDMPRRCIHPRAEEDGGWVERGAGAGGGLWRCVEADLWGETCK